MNQALVKFQFENNIFSVSGFSPKLIVGGTLMIHLWFEKLIVGDGVRGSDRWETVDWNIADWNEFRFNKKIKKNLIN